MSDFQAVIEKVIARCGFPCSSSDASSDDAARTSAATLSPRRR